MEEKPASVLIVEDEMIIAANLSLQLTELGYEVTGIVPRGEDALHHMADNRPDVVLMDINLKGSLDGIETVCRLQAIHNVAIIYLTANADDAHFNRAKATRPSAFISKPYKKLDLQRALALAVESHKAIENDPAIPEKELMLEDRIFVRHNDKMIRVMLQDISYLEADRNYCRIFTQDQEYLLVGTLKKIEHKLPPKYFTRVHRSFIINLTHIDEVATNHLMIADKLIPLTKPAKDELLMRLQTL
ncbi:LytR/AlgR family response regulator transcription factor [Tunicatimonas pelagia]|uniref:LytR/AlgR family response regulator transcription factor n=1 Tax=Tunicatimonas pelagia TaxID=931531 RepID=UPI0026652B95|nr:response regulator [Tunicatimonas pelagia]WKN45068.1 response regulator [Tunicatimonas pelagia]